VTLRHRGWFLIAALAAPAALVAQDAADSAWSAGATARAERLYRARVEADSTDGRALHRLALIAAWNERYAESLALFDRLLARAPDNMEAAVDRATVVAWQGRTRDAIAALDTILERHPTLVPALKARAQFAAWEGETAEALATYDRIAGLLPDDRTVRRDRARTLTWASRFADAATAYDSLIATDPKDRAARLGLAQVMAWSGRTDSAEALYRSVLAIDSTDLGARRGLARTATWQGDLVRGERLWRDVVARDSSDIAGLVGLAQTLRWEGRTAAADRALRRAERTAPGNQDVRTERRWLDVAIRPSIGTHVVGEFDSDDNDIVTTSVRGAWRPMPALRVVGEGYHRSASGPAGGSHNSLGGMIRGEVEVGVGWVFAAGLGGSDADAPGAGANARWTLGMTTPGRARIGGSLSASHGALDATAVLMERGVTVDEVGADLRAQPASPIQATGALSLAWFDGSVRNRRVAGRVGVTWRLGSMWTVGGAARAFGFQQRVADGYFSPDFYGLVEVTGRWRWTPDRWRLAAELGPGLQRVGREGDVRGALRTYLQAGYEFAPGREVSLTVTTSSAGLQSFSTATADYRYLAVGLAGSWGF